MKKFTLLTLACAAVALMSGVASAQSACGGSIVYDNDCGSNPRSYASTCCNAGEVAVGVGYNDMGSPQNNQKDVADAVSVICSNASGTYFKPSDNQNYPVFYKCDAGEKFIGIACKDTPKDDELDGCTAVCSKNGSRRVVYNQDLAGNPRGYNEITVGPNQTIIGVAYKDRAGANHIGSSDQADCASVVTR